MFIAFKIRIFIWILYIITLIRCDDEVNLGNKLSGLIKWNYEKRPFCNAFTGCGRKRVPYPLAKRLEIDDRSYINDITGEALSDLIDINAEPAIENVQKQIMSQAKLFEAIKEASKELFRQKNQQRLRSMERQNVEAEENRNGNN